jgi:hypothetical protein
VDRGHRAYLENGQQQEYHNGGELLVHLCLGLKEFPALDAVVLGGTWGDSLTDRRFNPAKLQSTAAGAPARTWNPLFLEPKAIGRRAYGHVDFFTVIRALSLSQKRVSKFKSTRWLNSIKTHLTPKPWCLLRSYITPLMHWTRWRGWPWAD